MQWQHVSSDNFISFSVFFLCNSLSFSVDFIPWAGLCVSVCVFLEIFLIEEGRSSTAQQLNDEHISIGLRILWSFIIINT